MDALGTVERHGESADLRYERHYPRPIETVWAAMTDPVRIADWLGPAEVEPRAGGRYVLFTDRKQPMQGRIRTWEPPWLLEYSWNIEHGGGAESLVRCELSPDGAGTRLIFRHIGLGFPWIGLIMPGWHNNLERLDSLLTGEPQPASPERWRALQTTYIEHYELKGVLRDRPTGHRD